MNAMESLSEISGLRGNKVYFRLILIQEVLSAWLTSGCRLQAMSEDNMCCIMCFTLKRVSRESQLHLLR